MVEVNVIPRVFLAELFGLGNRLLMNTGGGGLPAEQIKVVARGEGLPNGDPAYASTGSRTDAYRNNALTGKQDFNKWGQPVFTSVVLKNGADTLVMPDAIVEVTRPKVVVKTQVAGRNGTVKEVVSWDDYQIKVRAILTYGKDKTVRVGGRLFSAERWYPVQEVDKFVRICNHHGSVELLEDFHLRVLKIKEVVIEGYSLINTPQVTNLQVVEFECVSDERIELKLAR